MTRDVRSLVRREGLKGLAKVSLTPDEKQTVIGKADIAPL